jgi:ParB/RepB/Spo0J family partition protein
MRADSHYVDELDSTAPTQIIRVLPIDRIKIDGSDQPSAAVSLVESIRRHGVLQPLLVQHSRDGYKLIAGRKRLSAAKAADITAVPCLVHHVDDQEAEQLALAANSTVERVDDEGDDTVQSRIGVLAVQRTAAELSRSLARIGSCSNLLESAELTQQVLSGIVRVEACRSWCLGHALTVLADTASPRPARISAKVVGRRVLERCEAERRVRGALLETRASVRDATDVIADAELLAAVLSGSVLAALEGCEEASSEPVTLSIDVKSGTDKRASEVVFGVSRRTNGAMPRGATGFADVMRQAVEKLAVLLGGRVLPIDGQDTVAQIALPLAQTN